MDYESIKELVGLAEMEKVSIGQVVLKDQAILCESTEEIIFNRMDKSLSVMENSVRDGLRKDIKSASGLSGGDAYKMKSAAARGIMGEFMDMVAARAIAVSESNAAMGCIVAAPTAGSCGIMPACLIGLMEEKKVPREKIVLSMFTAAGIGMVIAKNASISGAKGGCQAECGSAAGMTAAAIVEALGGTPSEASEACAIALKNELGLICDPVAGLVEVPCIKRNAGCAVMACAAADMALAGIKSKIPADEVIFAMKEVGDALPSSLKETACGGLAVTPTGILLKKEIFGEK